MVRLRFSRHGSSHSPGSGVAANDGDANHNNDHPDRAAGRTTPRQRAPNGEDAVVDGGNDASPPVLRSSVRLANNNNNTNNLGGGGGIGDIQSSRGNRPPSSGREDAKKRAAKRVLKLLDSPRKAIMGRTRGGGTVGGGGGNGRRSGGDNNAGNRQSLAQRGRSASVPAGLGGNVDRGNPGVASSSSSSSALNVGLVNAATANPNLGYLSHRQVSPDHGSGLWMSTSASMSGRAMKGSYGYADGLNTTRSYGFPVQQEAFIGGDGGLGMGSGATVGTGSGTGRLKDDGSGAANVLQWLHNEAPQDILPRVLSFAGSRKIDALSRTCKSWRAIALSDAVWKTACEDTGKWTTDDDADADGSRRPRGTWLQHYRDNPIVPDDYGTIEAAFRVGAFDGSDSSALRQRGDDGAVDGNNVRPAVPEHRRSVRVLLRPGRYVIRESLIVHAVGDREVTIETVEGSSSSSSSSSSPSLSHPGHPWSDDAAVEEDADFAAGEGAEAAASSALASSGGTPSRLSRRATSLRNLLSCRSSAGSDVHEASAGTAGVGADDDVFMEDAPMPNIPGYDFSVSEASSFGRSLYGSAGGRFLSSSSALLYRPPPKRAVIVLKTRKHNEPIVRVRQGTVKLRNVDLVHNSSGTDIWNGNAAVQVQPPFDEHDNPLTAVPPSTPPAAVLESVDIVSFSGRGVVNIDGGYASIRDCYIHNCAATGIYVGGPGSVADVVRTDVVRNGNGNERSRRGIARGHSGVYLEQGVATLRDCNVSDNSLTGISAISADNATLTVEDTDLMSNGSIQLELPPLGSASHRRSVSRNNSVSAGGRGRSRSGLMAAAISSPADDGVARGTPSRRSRVSGGPDEDGGGGEPRPQSPAEDAAMDDDGDGDDGEIGVGSPAAAADAAASASASARRRMRFAALDEGNLGGGGAAVPLVD